MTEDWFPKERRTAPKPDEVLGLIVAQNHAIAETVDDAMRVAREAKDAAVKNQVSLERLAACYEQHVCDSEWLPEMREDLRALINAMRFILTLQKVAIWVSKFLAGLLLFIATLIGLAEYVMPWLSALIHAHKPPPP